MNRKHIGLGAFGGSVALMCAASVAWACTYQPHIFSLTADAGAPGSAVTVNGQAVASQGQVEIHWNGATGPMIGQAAVGSTGNFSIPVTIPATATPDVYFLVAVAGNASVARSAFEVTSPSTASTPGNAAPAASQSDAWNTGFAPQATAAGSHGASVIGGATQEGSNAGVITGVGLLAAGGLMLGGIGVATARRRRATANNR